MPTSDEKGSLTLAAFGCTVELAGTEEILAEARRRLPAAYRPTGGPARQRWSVQACEGGAWAVTVDGAERRRGDAEAALEVALSEIELFVAERAHGAVFVHAGCVAVGDRAMLLPGRTQSGKTSLTMALVEAGAEYYSDEFAILAPDGTVTPYPRPPAVRDESGRSRRVAIEVAAGRRAPDVAADPEASHAPAVGIVAILRYDASAGWDVRPLSRGEAVLSLLANTVPAQLQPRASLTATAMAAAGAVAITGTRGDAADAARRLLDQLKAASPNTG